MALPLLLRRSLYPVALPFGLCNTQENQPRKPQGSREACPQLSSPLASPPTGGWDGAAALVFHWSDCSRGCDLAGPKLAPRSPTGFSAKLPCVPGAAGDPASDSGNAASWIHPRPPSVACYRGRSCFPCYCWRWQWPGHSTPSGAAGIAGLRSCRGAESWG